MTARTFFTDDKKRVRPIGSGPTISSFFGGSLSDVENAARRAILRKLQEQKTQKRIAAAKVDPHSIRGDSLNAYVEASRVTSLDSILHAAGLPVSAPATTHQQAIRQRRPKVKLLDNTKTASELVEYKFEPGPEFSYSYSLLNDGRIIIKYLGQKVEGAHYDLVLPKAKAAFAHELRQLGLLAPAEKKTRIYDDEALERDIRRKEQNKLKPYKPKNYNRLDLPTREMVDQGFKLSELKRIERREYAREHWQSHLTVDEAAALREGRIKDVGALYAQVYRHITGEDLPQSVETSVVTYETPKKYKSISIMAGNEDKIRQGGPAPF